MGIKDLFKILSVKHTDVLKNTNISDFQNKYIAIDILTFIYKFIRSSGEERWINQLLLMFYKLQKNNIKIICIFDGKNYPIEKRNEHQIRALNIKKIEEKYIKILELKEKVKNDMVKNVNLIENINLLNNIITKRNKSFIVTPESITYLNLLRNIKDVELKLYKQCIKITYKHIELVKEMMNSMNIKYLIADGEAEKLCSYLCFKGIVDAVLSEDSDVIAYETPTFISKINLKDDSMIVINYKNILNATNMTNKQFKDFCILCGCDYNSRIKIKSKNYKKDSGIGSIKAYKLIKDYGTIENIEKNTGFDITPLNYISCREIFSFLEYDNIFSLKDVIFDDINTNKLEIFLDKHNVKININMWKKIENDNIYKKVLKQTEDLNI